MIQKYLLPSLAILGALFGLFIVFRTQKKCPYSTYSFPSGEIPLERGVKITVLSEVADLYVTICYFQEKTALAEELVGFDEGLLALSTERFNAGLTDEEEVVETLSISNRIEPLSVYWKRL